VTTNKWGNQPIRAVKGLPLCRLAPQPAGSPALSTGRFFAGRQKVTRMRAPCTKERWTLPEIAQLCH